MGRLIKNNVGFQRWFFITGYDSTSVLGIGSNLNFAPAGVTGLTINVQIAKEGAMTPAFNDPFAGPLNLTECTSPSAQGWYFALFSPQDADTLGALMYQLTWGGSNSLGDQDQVVLGYPGDIINVADVTGLPGLELTQNGGFCTAQAGSSTTITLQATGASGTDGFYVGAKVFLAGAISGQVRTVIAYNGTTKVATVDRAWQANPSDTTTYLLYFDNSVALDSVLRVGMGNINGSTAAATNLANAYAAFETGTAQAGGASSITLRSGASAVNDFYKDQAVFVLSGTGAPQTNRITAYNGTTKVATVETAWVTQPDNTSVYIVVGRIG